MGPWCAALTAHDTHLRMHTKISSVPLAELGVGPHSGLLDAGTTPVSHRFLLLATQIHVRKAEL